jgi:hypothetical protein
MYLRKLSLKGRNVNNRMLSAGRHTRSMHCRLEWEKLYQLM